MSLHRCEEFNDTDGGGSSQLDNRIYKMFAHFENYPDTTRLVLTEFDFVLNNSPPQKNAAPVPIKTINLTINDNTKLYHYHDIDSSNVGCLCELLLFIIVNFDISSQCESTLLQAMSLYKDHLMTYRYNEHMDRLLFYLDEKKRSKQVIRFLYNSWNEYFPQDKLKFSP